jgi:acyl-coenzyme A thioesterase PaaI-like protein
MFSKARKLRWVMNVWPPFLFSGVHITHISDDFRHVEVELRDRWFNRNYVNTHFGGSLFSMTDPFWMIMVMENLSHDYYVWDKAAEIEFIKPGRGTVKVVFELSQTELDAIQQEAANGEKHLRWFPMTVKNSEGEVIARLRKQLYIKRKPEKQPAQ